MVSRVGYAGTERLSVLRGAKSVRFEARARYVRTGSGGKSNAEAHFVQTLGSDGYFKDREDYDPDFLTILNQPFAVQLDAATLHDVRELRGPIPFTAASPLGGTTLLHGFLRAGTNGAIGRRVTVAVRFEAQGRMDGPLPGRSEAAVAGTMKMDGTAYYAVDDAILLALYVTLTINARLQNNASNSIPVRITYRRSIRAAGNATASGTLAR